MEVLSVIQNWRRPANVARVVDAIRSQSVESKLAIVDCGLDGYVLPPDVLDKADYVFRVDKANLGPCCRFIPSMMLPQIPFTMFWLDDFLPGPRCLESFLKFRETIHNGHIATLGQDGRVFRENLSGIVRKRVSAPAGKLVSVDVVVSSELCLTRNVSNAIRLRDRVVAENIPESVSLFEDDLFLCQGISNAIRRSSKVFSPSTPEESHRIQRLASNDALSSRPYHDDLRNAMVSIISKTWVG